MTSAVPAHPTNDDFLSVDHSVECQSASSCTTDADQLDDSGGGGAADIAPDCDTNGIVSDENTGLFQPIINFRRKHSSNFIFIHVNVNSIRHKFAALHEVLSQNYVDYLAVSETKLDSSFPNSQFSAQDFTLHRKDNTASSGGLIVYVRSDLPHRRLHNAECEADGIETLCVEVTIGNSKTILVCVYKHPKVKSDIFIDEMCKMSNILAQVCDDYIYIGDMNCCPTKTSVIKDLCEIYGLKNLIKDPTCFKAKNPTLIDVVLVSKPSRFLEALNSNCEISDFHNFVGAATRRFAPSLKPHYITYRSYKNFNDSSFCADIMSAPFHVGNIFDDVEDTAWYYSELIGNIIDEHAPFKQKMVKRASVPYMNAELRKSLYRRNMARNKFRLYGKSYWEENRKQRNRVVAVRKKSLAKYFETKCQKQDRTFWQTVSPFMSDKRFRNGSEITLNEDGKTVVDCKEVSEIFNKYFVNIASTIGFDDSITSTTDALSKHASHPSIIKIKGHFSEKQTSFSFHSTDTKTVENKLKTLNVRKATGFDKIPAKLLRLAHSELSSPITYLINMCISKSVFPSVMKQAEVSPIYKKADNLSKGNYRPVSVLTILSKLYESVMNDQLVGHFCDIFNCLLSAFRKMYSCQSLLLKCVDDWKKSLDENHIVGLLFMDLSKAFDCLSHSLLISKLNAYGVQENACELIASYLSNRLQRVKIGNTRSEWMPLCKGVPQGSILGPLLFNVFINDLFLFIERCALYNYADDNSLSTGALSLNDVISDLRHDGNICIEWFHNNGMQANADKFQFMLVSKQKLGTQKICLADNTYIESVKQVKALGVTIDDKLTFTEHVSGMCRKAAKQLNALARIAKYLNVPSRRAIHQSFIASNFSYCPLVWHFCGKSNNKKIEKIHERSLRIIYGDYSSSYEDLISLAGTSTCLVSRLKHMMMEVFKSVNNLNPSHLGELFIVKDTPYEMRRQIKLVQPMRQTTTHGIRSFSYTGAKLFNQFPYELQQEMSGDDFKRLLIDWQVAEFENCV